MIPRRLIRCVPADPPAWAEEFWQAWKDLHPGWQFVTYRDPIDHRCFPLLGRWFTFCTSGAQLAGLVRLEAVHELGGIYVDMDMEPLRPLGPLLEAVGEFGADQAFIGTEDDQHLTDAMFGAPAGHAGIAACIDRVNDLFGDALAEDMHPPGAQATGPLNTTAVLKQRSDTVVLPRRMLYPYSYTERHRRHEDFRTTSPDSFAVHHWAFSWQGT